MFIARPDAKCLQCYNPFSYFGLWHLILPPPPPFIHLNNFYIQGRDLTNFSKYFQYFWTSLWSCWCERERGDSVCEAHNRAAQEYIVQCNIRLQHTAARQELSQTFLEAVQHHHDWVQRSGVLHGVAVQLEASRLQRPLHAPAWPKIGRDCTTTITTTKQGTSRSNTSLHFCPTVSRSLRTESCFEASVVC